MILKKKQQSENRVNAEAGSMGKEIKGSFIAKNLKFGIVAARFNEIVSSKLLAGAKDCLLRHGADEKNVDVAWVPGSFEIALAAQEMVKTKKYDAVICLGVLIRGETPHFDYLASQVSRALSVLTQESSVPVAFGVLTCETMEQAMDRAGGKMGNKGFEAAMTAIEMANLLKEIKKK